MHSLADIFFGFYRTGRRINRSTWVGDRMEYQVPFFFHSPGTVAQDYMIHSGELKWVA